MQTEQVRDERGAAAGRTTLEEALAADDPLAQWKAFYSLLVSAVPGLQGDEQYAFQFTNPERGADWYKEGRGSAVATLVDAKPASSGAFYGPGVSTVSDNYDMLLNAIKSDDPSLTKAKERFDKALEEDKLTMSLDGDLAADLESWKKGEGNPLDVTISKSTKIDHQWQIAAGGDVEVYGFNIAGNGEVVDKQLVDDKYALHIRYEAMRAYHMSRGKLWWNGGLVSVYNSDATEFSAPYTRATFFDPKRGLLNLIPSSVVVGYQYTLELTISRRNYTEFKIDMEGQGGFSYGPFTLNANIRFQKTDIDEADDSVTVTYKSISQEPVNFGVFSAMNTM